MSLDYQSSGVNIQAGNQAVDQIKQIVKSTYDSRVLSHLGGFAAAYDLSGINIKEPVLISCTDGVGTKVKIASQVDQLDGLGIDLVAMCVNDLICSGAKPLFFLDYIACESLKPDAMQRIVKGIAEGCKIAGCSLVGGEMAEMGDVYQKNEFDLAGFVVGIVEKGKLLTGQNITPGDQVYALPSSGVHSNGFSLVRKVLTKDIHKTIDLQSLLTPTKIYVKQALEIIEKYQDIRAFCHITGGGLKENIERLLPNTVDIGIEKKTWSIPEIFNKIQQVGQIDQIEMEKVFNMGLGLVLITKSPIQEKEWIKIGHVTAGEGEVHLID